MGDVKKIRNVAIVGHGGAGKTSLAEAMLFKAGATSRLGKPEDGTSTFDFDPDEKDRKNSIDSALATFQRNGCDWTVIDTPGLTDFQGEAVGSLRACDIALVAVAANSGVGVNTRAMLHVAEEENVGIAIVVTKTDADNVNVDEVVDQIQEIFGKRCIPFELNVGESAGFTAVKNCLDASDPDVASWRERLVEAVVEVDEAAMEKYLEEGEVSEETVRSLITRAIAARTVVPIYFTSVEKDIGVNQLMLAIENYFPSPADATPRTVGESPESADKPIACDPDGPLIGQVFKIMTDDYVGKLAFFRVYSGSVKANTNFFVPRTGNDEKMVNILTAVGKETTQVETASAGQIAAMARVEKIAIGDTFTDGEKLHLPLIPFPKPMVSLAVEPKARGDESKIGPALAKLVDEDPSLIVQRIEETHETVLSGLSDLHLSLKLGRMKRRSKVEVETKLPKIAYRETIAGSGDAQYRHKKQSGGAGQFAEVWMRISPVERGAGFEYKWSVVGGSISNNFRPSIEKGIRQVMEQGVIAGCRVIDVCCDVYDGKEHPVDSKDVAFQIAGREVFKEAMLKAKPVLLEPMMDIEIVVPAKNMGDITSDLNTRRGRIQGMDSQAGMQIIHAQVPLAEMQTYSTELRSLTGGEGTYRATLSHYDIVPPNVTNEIKARYLKELEAAREG